MTRQWFLPFLENKLRFKETPQKEILLKDIFSIGGGTR